MNKSTLCPTCKKKIGGADNNPFNPFCSEKCRLLDLGSWLDGSYSIADELSPIPEFDPDELDYSKH